MAYKNRQWLLGWPIKQAMLTGINKGNGLLDWPTKNRQWLLRWPMKQAIVTGMAYKKAMLGCSVEGGAGIAQWLEHRTRD